VTVLFKKSVLHAIASPFCSVGYSFSEVERRRGSFVSRFGGVPAGLIFAGNVWYRVATIGDALDVLFSHGRDCYTLFVPPSMS
jgi:hypothetical protein